MALAVEPAVTGKLPGDSGGRGGSCWAPRLRTSVKREALALSWAPRPRTPLLRPAPSLWERAAPTGPAFPGRELPARVSSVCGPRPGAPWAHCDPRVPPCLAAGTPSWPTPLPSAPRSRLGTALFLPGPAVPSCPQSVAAWRPSPKKPPAKGKVPLTAECMATAGTERIPEQSWGELEREGSRSHRSQASLRRPLPAGFAAQHTRSCCDYKRLLWAPSQERRGHRPHHPLSEGEDQGTGSQLALPSTSPCPAPVSPDRLAGTSAWRGEPTQGALRSSRTPAWACLQTDGQPSRPPSLPLVERGL